MNIPSYTNKGYLKLKDGAVFNKYQSKNPISKSLINGFKYSLLKFAKTINPQSIHEIGCGEGEIAELLASAIPVKIKATDYDENCIEHARTNNKNKNISYHIGNVYNLQKESDSAQLIVCCEVLEHLQNPEKALTQIKSLNAEFFIFSVPREPLWRILNIIRGKYWNVLGNTPTHIQHWSSRSFINLISNHFDVIDQSKPIPWTMLYCKKKN